MKHFGQAEHIADATVFLTGQDYFWLDKFSLLMADLACKKNKKDIGKIDETKSSCSNRLWIDLSLSENTQKNFGTVCKLGKSELRNH